MSLTSTSVVEEEVSTILESTLKQSTRSLTVALDVSAKSVKFDSSLKRKKL